MGRGASDNLGGPLSMSTYVQDLCDPEASRRMRAAKYIFSAGKERIASWIDHLREDDEFKSLLAQEQFENLHEDGIPQPRLTVGIAVLPETFAKIRAANGSPALADAPPDQDVLEFELEFEGGGAQKPRLDLLTTKDPQGGGAIARFLQKFGEGIQQVEIDVTGVDRATEILRTRFKIEPIYPTTRAGANGTRVNFFLVSTRDSQKVLVELVEQPGTNSR